MLAQAVFERPGPAGPNSPLPPELEEPCFTLLLSVITPTYFRHDNPAAVVYTKKKRKKKKSGMRKTRDTEHVISAGTGGECATLRLLPLDLQTIIPALLRFVTEHPEVRLDLHRNRGKKRKT